MEKKRGNCRLLPFSSSSFPLVDPTSFKNDLPPPPLARVRRVQGVAQRASDAARGRGGGDEGALDAEEAAGRLSSLFFFEGGRG